jgi:hypothetical protein
VFNTGEALPKAEADGEASAAIPFVNQISGGIRDQVGAGDVGAAGALGGDVPPDAGVDATKPAEAAPDLICVRLGGFHGLVDGDCSSVAHHRLTGCGEGVFQEVVRRRIGGVSGNVEI